MTGTGRLVSCLMVTKPGRFDFVKQSVAAYCAQTYPHRELLVLLDNATADQVSVIEAYLAGFGRADIRLSVVAGQLSLGALRNRSVSEARGDLLCQWDDDDLHHPTRLAAQTAALAASGRRACYLTDVFQYVSATRELFWTNWAMTLGQVHPGTLLAEARAVPAYPESGPTAALGEDLDVLTRLHGERNVHGLSGLPQLFVYVTHASNTWPMDHHRMLVERLALSRGLLLRRESQIRAGLAAFDFGAEDVNVVGSNGRAFGLAPQDGART